MYDGDAPSVVLVCAWIVGMVICWKVVTFLTGLIKTIFETILKIAITAGLTFLILYIINQKLQINGLTTAFMSVKTMIETMIQMIGKLTRPYIISYIKMAVSQLE